MAQNTHILIDWFVTDRNRAKAQLKYELRHFESRLNKYLETHSELQYSPHEVSSLCLTIAYRYLDYLKLVDVKANLTFSALPHSHTSLNWSEYHSQIQRLKQQSHKAADLREESLLISEIASLYYQCSQMCLLVNAHQIDRAEIEKSPDELKQLLQARDLKSKLSALVNLWNQNIDLDLELSSLVCDSTLAQQQLALDLFTDGEFIQLTNALFFYKLYPEKLYTELIHPEKLVSVRMRLAFLHQYIELLQKQLYSTAIQHGLRPGIDLMFHGDELPQGIMIEVSQELRELIQAAVKNLKAKFTPESEEQIAIEHLHDLVRAYKFWFNPNRLIDAVMLLQQRLVKEAHSVKAHAIAFHQEMLSLYQQLTTTECLDLYGYFANNDSRYLLYTLFIISQGKSMDWLPNITASERSTIERVFKSLQCVMEALRDELKNRHITTEPYVYDLAKNQIKARRRNRDAVLRILAIYGSGTVSISDAVEQLFRSVEEIKPVTE